MKKKLKKLKTLILDKADNLDNSDKNSSKEISNQAEELKSPRLFKLNKIEE
jgi:hypothetical protein